MNIVWTIAGSDSSAGAGIQTDLATFSDFKVHGCSAVTVLTAQNSVGVQAASYVDGMMLNHQINSLKNDLPAKAIKLGVLGSKDNLKSVSLFLQHYTGPVIADPVFIATTGARLADENLATLYCRYIFPYTTLLTPNAAETQILTGITLNSIEDYQCAAQKLLAMGCQAVLIKSGDTSWDSQLSSDYYADNKQCYWINHYRINTKHSHGTGCTLSSAICASLALGYSLHEAIVLGKAYTHAGLKAAIGLGKGGGNVAHTGFPDNHLDLPWISQSPQDLNPAFPECQQAIGLYPLVNNLKDLKFCIKHGFNTVQLRIKNTEQSTLKTLISEAVAMAKETNTQLFINDHWQLAIEAKAYGVHLGQEEIANADIRAIHKAGLHLGISTNCLYSLSKAYTYNPSYLASGPVFLTGSKADAKPVIGLQKLKVIADLSPKPLCAIGGIKKSDFKKIQQLGCQGIAFIQTLENFKKLDELTS